jgi:site-specific DNA-cytosine methylase
MNILIACEESQTVCKEFRKLGYNAYSCDTVQCSGGHPEWHLHGDVLQVIDNNGGTLQSGEQLTLQGKWDMMIAHPPCTYLSVSGAKWYYHPEDKHLPIDERRPHPKFPNRAKDRDSAIDFFMKLMDADIEYIAIENPVGIMSTKYRKPEQIVQPYHFGDSASKTTCLWLKNLPLLKPTNIVDKGEFVNFASGNKMPKWYSDAFTQTKSAKERSKIRSKTFPGFANAMANQWGKVQSEKK